MYNAEQLSSIFDGIISDGMYSNYRNSMIVIESENDNEVIVQPGRAWLMHTWSLVDANLPIEAPQSEVVLDRIDALVIDVNTNPEVKNNEITWVQGTPSSQDPQKPELLNEEFHKQYPLCYVYRAAGTEHIAQENITNAVGTSELPFVTGIIDTINTDQLILQWEAQWETFMETYTSEAETWIDTQEGSFLAWSTAQRTAFETWFESIRGILDQDAAGHIMNIIDARIPAYDSENPAQQITAVRSRKGNYISELRVYANAKPRLFQSADGGQTWEDSSVGGFEPVEISYEDYLALTDEEKNAGDWYVVGMPPMGLNAKTIPYHGDISDAENVEDAIDKVNQNLTLNYDDSSLPSSTTFNEFAQMVLDKLYPKGLDVNAQPIDFFMNMDVGCSVDPITITGRANSNTSIRTNEIDFSLYKSAKIGVTTSNGETGIFTLAYYPNGTYTVLINTVNIQGQTNFTVDLRTINANARMLIVANTGSKNLAFTEFFLEPND